MEITLIESCYKEEESLYQKLVAIHQTIVAYGGNPKYPVCSNSVSKKSISPINDNKFSIDWSWKDKILFVLKELNEGTVIQMTDKLKEYDSDSYTDDQIKHAITQTASKMYKNGKGILDKKGIKREGYIYFIK